MIEFYFVNASGQTMFTRSDAESARWTVQELSLNATFPYNNLKIIRRGYRIAFRDPVTSRYQMFEIRNVVTREPSHGQQIVAENIAVSELSDDHINKAEINNKTAAQALSAALTGTLWSVGTNTASGTQSADFSRGNVWQAVSVIKKHWNVNITPRIVISTSGQILSRYLDIEPAGGTWNGLRLSVKKNLLDPSVTYDDESVYTALYGYGGMVDVQQSGGDDTTEELTFANVVWSATSDHPAKPSGQTYLEDPAKTAIYGRDGRPRFGFYQNSAITDPDVLIQKTWETLKNISEPKISIRGTCIDLYRLGYKDEPLRLHDKVLVEIEETGETFFKEITQLDYDLIIPANNAVTIGDYIPNIIYINRKTSEHASGGGGGGGHGQTNAQVEESDTFAMFEKTNDKVGMVVGTRNGGYYVKAGEIALSINRSGETGQYESTALINADHVNISATTTAYTLAGSLERTADGKLLIKDAGGLYVQRTEGGTTAQFGVWDNGNLTGGVMVSQINGQSSVKISGDVVDINGSSIIINADRIDINGIVSSLSGKDITTRSLSVGNNCDVFGSLSVLRGLTTDSLTVGSSSASWQHLVVVTEVDFTTQTRDRTTIHYLGYLGSGGGTT